MAAALIVWGPACSRVDYVLGVKEVAASGGAGSSGMGGAGAAGLGDFGAPTLVEALCWSDADDDDPTLTPDLLEIWFSSTRPGGLGASDIWHSVRETPTAVWQEPTLVAELSSEAAETSVAVSRDALEIWVTTAREGGSGAFDIWVATRDSRQGSWSEPEPVVELNSEVDDLARGPDRTGRELWMASKRASDGEVYDIFVATRAGRSEPWAAPVEVTELNSEAYDADPFLAVDDRTIFFTSSRAESTDDDLYVAVRPGPTESFGSAEPLSELNGPGRDGDPWVSDDLRYIIYASEHEDEGINLYEAWR